MNKKNTILVISILVFGLVLAGGTYAWLTASVNVTNGKYNLTSDCFMIDYTDNTQTITGTLFPSVGPNKGLSGSVTMKVNDNCNAEGVGTLYLHVNNGTSTKFGDTVSAHCENPKTLVTLPEYTTSSACSSYGIWVTSGSALKFALNPSTISLSSTIPSPILCSVA